MKILGYYGLTTTTTTKCPNEIRRFDWIKLIDLYWLVNTDLIIWLANKSAWVGKHRGRTWLKGLKLCRFCKIPSTHSSTHSACSPALNWWHIKFSKIFDRFVNVKFVRIFRKTSVWRILASNIKTLYYTTIL